MPSIFRQLILVTLLTAAGARAEEPAGWQNLDAVDAAVTIALGGNGLVGGGKARPVDRRIKLARCAEALSVSAPIAGSVTVECVSIGWRIRLPVVMAATVAGPPMMRKGDPVSVVTGLSGISASIMGIADGEGRVGDRVRVKTGSGSAALVGQIAGPGTVRIF
jgi:flagella basal body P-ring formation protein FlgA